MGAGTLKGRGSETRRAVGSREGSRGGADALERKAPDAGGVPENNGRLLSGNRNGATEISDENGAESDGPKVGPGILCQDASLARDESGQVVGAAADTRRGSKKERTSGADRSGEIYGQNKVPARPSAGRREVRVDGTATWSGNLGRNNRSVRTVSRRDGEATSREDGQGKGLTRGAQKDINSCD